MTFDPECVKPQTGEKPVQVNTRISQAAEVVLNYLVFVGEKESKGALALELITTQIEEQMPEIRATIENAHPGSGPLAERLNEVRAAVDIIDPPEDVPGQQQP